MFHKIALLLVIISAANIGLITLLHVDILAVLGGVLPVINVLVGLSGLYLLLDHYTTLLKS